MYTVPTREIASMLQSDQFCQRSQGHGPPRPQQREPPACPGGGSGLTVAKAIRTRLGAAQRWQEDLARAEPERGRVRRAPGRTGGRRRSAFPGAPNASAGDGAPPAGHREPLQDRESAGVCFRKITAVGTRGWGRAGLGRCRNPSERPRGRRGWLPTSRPESNAEPRGFTMLQAPSAGLKGERRKSSDSRHSHTVDSYLLRYSFSC